MKPLTQYNEYGYAVVRNVLSDNELVLLSKHVDRIYQMWRLQHEADIYKYKMVNMHSLTHPAYFEDMPEQREAFFNLLAGPALTSLLETMFGSDLHFHNTQLFFNPSNSERLPYWHRDMQYSDIDDAVQHAEQTNMLSLHVRIPLLTETGVEVVPGSHRRWDTQQEKNVRFELNGHKNSEPLAGAELITLTPGDVLIFNAQMLHRGNYALNPARKALDLCIGKYHPISSQLLDPCVLPTQEELHSITHNRWYKLAKELSDSDAR